MGREIGPQRNGGTEGGGKAETEGRRANNILRVPLRWSLNWVVGVFFYKHGAPLELGWIGGGVPTGSSNMDMQDGQDGGGKAEIERV